MTTEPVVAGPPEDEPQSAGESRVWEVFRREKEGDPMRHAGSVVAPDAELATHYARELYGRRQESVALWVVARAAVVVVDDPDLLDPPLDRSFKKPAGYSTGIKEKLEAARQRVAEESGGSTVSGEAR